MTDLSFMQEAIVEARLAAEAGEVPIGAVLVCQDQIIARAHNTREESKNPLHHAEILVLEAGAKKIGDWRLEKTVLYVTLEPCPMCLGALLQARVSRLVYGCADPNRKDSFFPSLEGKTEIAGNNHLLKIMGGVLQDECGRLLKEFFKSCRSLPKNPLKS